MSKTGKTLNICPVCLRSDRKLKTISTVLSVYHDELTDYSLEISNPRYCSDCEYLLRKTYNFQQKCSNAAKILQKWKKNKISPDLLHLKLPPINLDTYKLGNKNVFTYTCSDDLETPTLEESKSNKADTVTIKEVNISEKLNTDIVKEEVNETIHSESLVKIEIHCEDYHVTGVSETLFQNSNIDSGDISRNYNITPKAGISGIVNTENKKNMVKKANSTTSTGYKDRKSYIEVESNINDTAKNRSNKNYNVNDTFKSTDDVTLTNIMVKLSNDMPTSSNAMLKSTDEEMNFTHDSNDKSTFAEPEDTDVELIGLDDDDDSKNDSIISIDDESDPDDASLNSDDDCDDYLYTPPEKSKNKMTLDELADIALSDEDFDDDYVFEQRKMNKNTKKDYSIEKLISTEKMITSKIEDMNETLDSVCKNWEITSLLDVGIPNLSNDEVKIFTRQYLTERKAPDKKHSSKLKSLKKRGIEAKLAYMRAELHSINVKCAKMVEEYKNGLNDPKERLKADLIEKFESWGELRADDGFIFDKDVIINCLDMVNERLIRQLITLLHGASSLSPGAVVILKRIQNKQNENKYESVFNIEYMTTEREMLEEFERRKTYECYVEAKFKCEICYQGFKHERLLDYHKKCHDESSGTISCTICHVRYHSRRRLKKHMAAHVAAYKCKLCPLVTYYRLSMINHYEQHKGTLYKCEPCGGTYKSKSAYLSHQTHTHPSGAHVCTTCGRAFISPLGLKKHATRMHRGETPVVQGGAGVKCEPCQLTFPSQEAFWRHQRSLHGAPPAYKKKRPPMFLKPRKKPNLTCRVCNTVGHSYGWLTLHFSTEHPSVDMAAAYADKRTYLCDICGKGFSNKYTLREHIGLHTGVTFPCATCGKRFLSRAALRRHRLTHAPPGFCCERCGKKFHSYPNLYNHMRSHIGDRRFKCNICGKGFLHRCSLKEHIRGVHNHERRVRKRGAPDMHGVLETGPLEVGAQARDDDEMEGVLETAESEMPLNPE